MKIRVGTRKSILALKQTEILIEKLMQLDIGLTCEVVSMSTTGDKLYNADLAKVGGKGLFLKELEEALFRGDIDIAVHSLKDVPAFLPEGLELGCFLEREDPRDAFLSVKHGSLMDMPAGAVVGTSSLRRLVQLRKMRSDLQVVPLRGNVQTRLTKMRDGEVDACVLACAGLRRLGLMAEAKQVFSLEEMVPAVGQGVICVEYVSVCGWIGEILKLVNHKDTEIAVTAERAFMQKLSGNCTTPLGAYGQVDEGMVRLNAVYAASIDTPIMNVSAEAPVDEAVEAGYECSDMVEQSVNAR